jgi:LacI family transcriptional regulator
MTGDARLRVVANPQGGDLAKSFPPLIVRFMSGIPKKKKLSHAATLSDVGREAGVSAMAVSAVLNGARTSSRIAPDTRARILDAAAKLDYRPNAAARALVRRRMNTIGVVAVIEGGELNHYFLEVFNGVLASAARHGQNTTVFTLHDWDRDARRIGGFCDGRIDGLVMIAPLLDAEAVSALPSHTPMVAIHANHPLEGIVDLESDEEAGSCALVSRLIELGHRRILHLAGPVGQRGAERRVAGYRRALEQAGLPFDPALVRVAGFSIPEGREATRLWLRSTSADERATAIFCANDGVAFGCMETLAAAGLRVPDDVSVAGFDDTLLARACLPQLSSVRQPLRHMGERAVEILLDLTRGAPAPRSVNVFPTEPVLRASVAAPLKPAPV